MDRWGELAQLARRQHGLVTTRQAAELGITHQRLSDRSSQSGWIRKYQGVFALAGVPSSFEQDVCAALLAANCPAAASHRTAAALWGLTEPPQGGVEIIVPRRFHPRSRPDLTIHRSGTLRTADMVRFRGLRITGPPRTFCDLASPLAPDDLRELLACSLQRRLTRAERVAWRARDMGAFRGAEKLGLVLRELTEERTDSWLERRVRRKLRAIDLPPHPGIFDVTNGGRLLARLDVAYPAVLVGVEIDGFPWHSTPAQLRADHDRANLLAALGWTLLRIGYAQARDDFNGFAAQLRAVLDRKTPG